MTDLRPLPRSRRDVSGFERPLCLNCGAAVDSKFCPACGQKRAGRLGARDVTDLAWENLRRFEFSVFKAMFRVAVAPGRVARDYVLGARARTIHPFKLLLTTIVFLILMIGKTGYLTASTKELSKAVELALAWQKWTFSLGLFAIFAASMLAFWYWRSFNWVEHLVLAAYTHSTVLMANIVNIAPLLIWNDTATVIAHRAAAKSYMSWIEAAIVCLAYMQFFNLSWRKQLWWAVAATTLYWWIKAGLVWLFARAVIRLVLAQMT